MLKDPSPLAGFQNVFFILKLLVWLSIAYGLLFSNAKLHIKLFNMVLLSLRKAKRPPLSLQTVQS